MVQIPVRLQEALKRGDGDLCLTKILEGNPVRNLAIRLQSSHKNVN